MAQTCIDGARKLKKNYPGHRLQLILLRFIIPYNKIALFKYLQIRWIPQIPRFFFVNNHSFFVTLRLQRS